MYEGQVVFSQVMHFLPLRAFHRCVARYKGQYKVQKFACLDQFLCMAFAQLTYRESLRDIEVCLRGNPSKLYHMGIRSHVAKSTLADANETRDWRIYADFAQVLITRARDLYTNEDFGLELDNTVYALDATTIDLCLSVYPWARFRKTKGAVKMHTLLNLRGNIPEFIHISDGKMADVNVLDILIPEPGSFYIMDRGYIDFSRLYAMHQSLAFFCDTGKAWLSIQASILPPRGQVYRLAIRPDDHPHGCGHGQVLPRADTPHSLLRRRDAKTLCLPHQQLHPRGHPHCTAVQSKVESRTFLQMDKAAPPHQKVLWDLRERCEDANLDRCRCLCPRGDHQEGTWAQTKPLHNSTVFERLDFRENAHFTGSFGAGIRN